MEELLSAKDLVIYAAYALIGGATFLIARTLLQEQEKQQAQDNLAENRKPPSNGLVKLTRPFFNQYVMPMVRGKPYWDNQRREYRRKLIAAGLKDEFTPDEFISFKLFLILFFPIVGGLLQAGDFIDVPVIVIILSGGAGWMYPDMWMKGKIERRQDQILKSMPFIVDLLALSTEAGLDFVGAIGKVVEKAKPSPLVEEMAQLLREIKVGSSRQTALREMGARIDMPQMNSFIAILISADQMGASIGKILRQQSESIRQERTLRAEKAGAKAASALNFPIFFLIVPAVFLMIFAPVALEMLYGNGG